MDIITNAVVLYSKKKGTFFVLYVETSQVLRRIFKDSMDTTGNLGSLNRILEPLKGSLSSWNL